MEKFDSSVLNEQLVPFTESHALRLLGFDEPCFGAWMKNTEIPSMGRYPDQIEVVLDGGCLAPLWQQAFEFFRVKYNFESNIRQYATVSTKFWWHINFIDIKQDKKIKGASSICLSYEEARLKCLQKLIGIAKNGYKDLFHS